MCFEDSVLPGNRNMSVPDEETMCRFKSQWLEIVLNAYDARLPGILWVNGWTTQFAGCVVLKFEVTG